LVTVIGGANDGGSFHPVNDDADEHASMSGAPGTCFFAFIKT
jgi:hypothetical protein